MEFIGQARRLLILLMLAPSLAFAAPTETDRGTGGNNTSESSTTVTGITMAAGSTGVLCVAADNANGATVNLPSTTITDSAGNIWVARINIAGFAAVNGSVERALYTAQITNALSSGSLTITYVTNPVVAKAWTLTELIPGTAGDVFLTLRTVSSAITNTTTPTVNILTAASNNDVTIGFGAAEAVAGQWTGDTDTADASWSTQQTTGFGSVAASSMSITSQVKISPATGSAALTTQTYNPTLAVLSDAAVAAIILCEMPPAARTIFTGSGGTSETQAFGEPLTAGSTAVIVWAGDNSALNGAATNVTTFTDTQSNTWTKRQDVFFDNGAASAGAEVAIFTSTLTTSLSRTDTGTMSYGTTELNHHWIVLEFTDATAYNASGGASNTPPQGGTTSSPSITTSSITNGHYVIGLLGLEADGSTTITPDSDTSNGSWSSPAMHINGLTTSGFGLVAQYKRVTGTATQTFNVGLGASADTTMAWADITAPSVSTQSATNGFFLWK